MEATPLTQVAKFQSGENFTYEIMAESTLFDCSFTYKTLETSAKKPILALVERAVLMISASTARELAVSTKQKTVVQSLPTTTSTKSTTTSTSTPTTSTKSTVTTSTVTPSTSPEVSWFINGYPWLIGGVSGTGVLASIARVYTTMPESMRRAALSTITARASSIWADPTQEKPTDARKSSRQRSKRPSRAPRSDAARRGRSRKASRSDSPEQRRSSIVSSIASSSADQWKSKKGRESRSVRQGKSGKARSMYSARKGKKSTKAPRSGNGKRAESVSVEIRPKRKQAAEKRKSFNNETAVSAEDIIHLRSITSSDSQSKKELVVDTTKLEAAPDTLQNQEQDSRIFHIYGNDDDNSSDIKRIVLIV
ncbi:unnamed protein product [Cylicocyclus nassatus]|uniref:Uncharacterized protein n=1 Tax=Cylicocyclus nassatus TaxID=53992 RepID=A0AA36MF23_CYLNA|nr:unnamed protein product [Cylicocyclus nassatus]